MLNHGRWLRTVVRGRLQDPDAVDDVLQEIALAVSQHHLRPTEQEKVAPWLYRVAIRQCLQQRRRMGRYRRFVENYSTYADLFRDSPRQPVDWLLDDEQRQSVREALERLPDLDREILLLKHTQGWTYQQLADHLGVTVHTIEYRLLQARRRLRSELAAIEVEVTR